MFGREVFRFTGRESHRTELRCLVRENRTAAAAVVSEQRIALLNKGGANNGWVNTGTKYANPTSEMPIGGKRFGNSVRSFDTGVSAAAGTASGPSSGPSSFGTNPGRRIGNT